MAKLFNSPIYSRTATTGERRFAARLDALLEDDYLCWFDVPIGPKRQHPDFVVLHPRRGLLVLEVKDWKIDSLRRMDKFSVDLLLASGTIKRIPNPLEQVRSYAHAVANVLVADPALRQSTGTHLGKLAFPYGYGVALSNITRAQLDAALADHEQELVLPAHRVICKDEMTESTQAMEFQEQLWRMFDYAFGATLSLPQIERVRWHLFPEIRIHSTQRDLLNDPKERKLFTVPDIVRVMDLQQEQLARSLGNGHRVIHGVAGSGKTLILGFRCLHLARTTTKPILVLCYNIALAARLRAFVAEHDLEPKVHVYHFHAWCKTQIDSYHVPVISSHQPVWERQVESVIAGVERGLIPRAQYGAVMIDEGHDFEPKWFKLVTQMIDPEGDSLLLLYDDAQSIYHRSDRLGFSLASVGIKAAGRTTILRLNYRNTHEILEFAYAFARSFIPPHAADEDGIPIVEPEAAGLSGPKPQMSLQPSVDAEIDHATNTLLQWYRSDVPLNEIAVITASPRHARLMKKRLDHERIQSLWMVSREEKAAYSPGVNRVTILTPHSSKGLEFRCVIFLGLGHFSEEHPADHARLIYVGMTRAREKLLLTASVTNLVTEKLLKLAA